MLHLAEKSRLSKNQNTTRRPHRIQSAQGTIRPWLSRAIASNVLFLVFESVEVSGKEQEQNSPRILTLVELSPALWIQKKGGGVEALIYLGPSTALHK